MIIPSTPVDGDKLPSLRSENFGDTPVPHITDLSPPDSVPLRGEGKKREEGNRLLPSVMWLDTPQTEYPSPPLGAHLCLLFLPPLYSTKPQKGAVSLQQSNLAMTLVQP